MISSISKPVPRVTEALISRILSVWSQQSGILILLIEDGAKMPCAHALLRLLARGDVVARDEGSRDRSKVLWGLGRL